MLENRGPFAMPRVNVAWDLDGQGNNVLRGGYGMFFNRNMGNVEYDQRAAARRRPPTRSTPTSATRRDPGGTAAA